MTIGGSAIQAIATAILALTGCYMVAMIALSRKSLSPVHLVAAPPVMTYFVIPALNEEKVIANTLRSLAGLDGEAEFLIIVVDDGSSDSTAGVVEHFGDPRVLLLRRELPNAQTGKGAVLNHAIAWIRADTTRRELDQSRVLVGIVDADGRLPSNALNVMSEVFLDPTVGGAQVQVRIINRMSSWMARCQDFEFLTFCTFVQSARQHLGSVGLGGNGQFTRLAALEDLGDEPWSDCLTEDLDLGLRLALLGWTNRFVPVTSVSQQGLTSLRRITRQRTRWIHGHFQCWRHMRAIALSERLSTLTALDLLWYLAGPALTLVTSLVFGVPTILLIVALLRAAFDGRIEVRWGYAMVLYGLSFAPSWALGLVYRRQARDISAWRTVVLVHVLAFYNYVWYVATWRALGRLILRRRGWAKTQRVDDVEAPVSIGRAT